jgi:hypothetical protein
VTNEDRQMLREIATRAARARREPSAESKLWELQTSNSFRRIGMHGDGDVLYATTHPHDRHPDLQALPGVLEYIIATQPCVVLELLDYIDKIEGDAMKVIENQRTEIERMRPTHELGEMLKVRDTIDKIIASKKDGLR